MLFAVTPVWSNRAYSLEDAFSNPRTAAFINDNFIPVRIDPALQPIPFGRCGLASERGLLVFTSDGAFAGNAGFPAPSGLAAALQALLPAVSAPEPSGGPVNIDAVLRSFYSSLVAAFNPRTGAIDGSDGNVPDIIHALTRRLYGTHDSETADILHGVLANIMAERRNPATGGFNAYPGERAEPLEYAVRFAAAFLQAYLVTGEKRYAGVAAAAAAYTDSVLYLAGRERYSYGIVAGSDGVPDTLTGNAWNAAAAAVLAEVAVTTGTGPVPERYVRILDSVLTTGKDIRSGLYYRNNGGYATFYLEDQARICRSALTMYELTGASRFADAARMLADRVLGRFPDEHGGGLYASVGRFGPAGTGRIAVGEAQMLEVLSRLDFLYENGTYRAVYDSLMPAVIACAAGAGVRGAGLMTAIEEPFAPLVEIFVVGDSGHAMTGKMLAAVKRRYLPFARIKVYAPRRGGHRRGALIFPYFLKPVCYAALNGYLRGAFERPEDLVGALEEAGF